MHAEYTFEHSDELFEAALEEFATRGYEAASINTILKAAGMSKGQYYYHFAGKEELYFALIDLLLARKRDFLAERMKPADLEGDIFTIFRAWVHHGVAFARAEPAISRFSERMAGEQGSPIYEKIMQRYNFEENDLMSQLIEGAFARGEFREDLPFPFIKRTIGYLFTHVAQIADLHEATTFEKNLHYLIEFMKSGLSRSTE